MNFEYSLPHEDPSPMSVCASVCHKPSIEAIGSATTLANGTGGCPTGFHPARISLLPVPSVLCRLTVSDPALTPAIFGTHLKTPSARLSFTLLIGEFARYMVVDV